MNTTQKNYILHFCIKPWFICCIGMLFYCFNYFLRVSPSVMQQDLMQHLHINAIQFGALAAFYYWAYTPMQIPVGLIYDRFGARLVQFSACLIAVIGVLIFILADTYSLACLGRFLIGLGTAFAYIGVLKLASLWLPANRFATIAGLTTAFGMVSAIISDKFLTQFVQSVGYQNALHITLFIGVTLSLFILFFMQNRPKIHPSHQPSASNKTLNAKELLNALSVILLNRQMWLIGIIGCLFYLPASVFLDLWGIPYLKIAYHLSPDQAATAVSWVFVGWIISGPSIGAISDKIKKRRLPLLISAIMSTVLMCTIFYIPDLTLTTLYILFFFVGIFCGAHPICFALGKENCPDSFSGTAVAVTNTLIMLGGMIFQPLVGFLLDKHTHTLLKTGESLYTANDYTYALSVVPLGLMLTILLTFFLKETHCESKAVLNRELSNNKTLATESTPI